MSRRVDIPSLRAASWTLRALREARRKLRQDGLNGFTLPAPPRLPERALRGVLAVLRRREHTCLERAVVLARWYAAHGIDREILIGVRNAGEEFQAHAWLEGEPGDAHTVFHEIMRVQVG